MNFLNAVKTSLKKYFVFKGRASRSEFWYFQLFIILYFLILAAGYVLLEMYVLFQSHGWSDQRFDIVSTLVFLPVVIPSITLSVRRLHDFNQTGWIYLVYAIPTGYLAFYESEFQQEIIYWIVQIIYYVYLSQKPSKEKNRFGSPAKKF